MATSLDLSRTYTSYSGVDIRIVINSEYVGSMQALSYAIQREKAPIYVMGSVDPISYSRGKRGIAGTMISLMMDIHLLYHAAFKNEKALLDNDEVIIGQVEGQNANYNDARSEASNFRPVVNPKFNPEQPNSLPRGTAFAADGFGRATASDFDESDLRNNYSVRKVTYVDQILPFDVVIVAANEYGNRAQMRLFGCEILNEGSGFSIDDMVIENQMTYVCRTILPWRGQQTNSGLYETLAGARGPQQPAEG